MLASGRRIWKSRSPLRSPKKTGILARLMDQGPTLFGSPIRAGEILAGIQEGWNFNND
jgi:hypothetical protein